MSKSTGGYRRIRLKLQKVGMKVANIINCENIKTWGCRYEKRKY